MKRGKENMKRLTIAITDEQWDQLAQYNKSSKIPKSVILQKAIDEYFYMLSQLDQQEKLKKEYGINEDY